MRIRTVKPEFFLHGDLYDAEVQSGLPLRLAFIGLWCAADREGRFKWEPRRLKAQILPYDEAVDFSRVLHALATRGFIRHYASSGAEFGDIPSFLRHQVINNRESASILPKHDDDNELVTRAPRVPNACPTPLNLDQGEGNGREGKGKDILRLEVEPQPEAQKEPRQKKERQRNPLIDALATIGGESIEEVTSPTFSRAAAALKMIREVMPNVTVEEIKRRAGNYLTHYPNAAITSTALAKNWATAARAKFINSQSFSAMPISNDRFDDTEEALFSNPH